jgi:hypothetical protein
MKIVRKRPGYALATILVLMGVAIFGIGALVSITGLETRISYSQREGLNAYSVAEAGQAEALWRLNTVPAYMTALAAGNLNVSFSVANKPATGQGYSVSMVSTSAGRALIDINATVNNGDFTARRSIRTSVFSGPVNNPLTSFSMFSGASVSITNGSGNVNFNGGDLYAGTTFDIRNTNMTVNGSVNAIGNYTANNSVVNASGGINAANDPPLATAVTAPSVDFNYYANNATVTYTPTQFQNLIGATGTNKNFPGPITYVNGNVSLGNSARNKNITISGLLVINGTFTTNASVSNLNVTINDPGTGLSGLLTSNNITLNSGSWTVNGVMYSAGTFRFLSAPALTINGMLIAASDITINPNTTTNIQSNATRIGAVFSGSGVPRAVQVEHWEEEY